MTLCCIWILMGFQEAQLLSLDQAIESALTHNRDLELVRLQVEEAQLQVQQERYAFQWQWRSGLASSDIGNDDSGLQLDISKRFAYGTEIHAGSFTQIQNQDGTRDSSLVLQITQPLLQNAGRSINQRALEAARARHQDALDLLEEARQQLALKVTRAYTQVLLQENLMGTQARALERMGSLVEATQIKVRIGRSSQVDLYRIQNLQNRTRLAYHRAQTQLARAQRALNDTMGQNLHSQYQLEPIQDRDTKWQHIDPNKLQARYTTTPQYRRLVRRIQQARLDHKVAKRALLPALALNLTYQTETQNPFDSKTSIADDSIKIGFSTGTNADQRRRNYRTRTLHNQLRRLEIDLENYKIRYQIQVQDQLQELHFTEQEIQLHQEAKHFAAQQLEVAQIRFERGLADNFDLVQAQSDLLEAEDRETRARINHKRQYQELKILVSL